MSSHNKQKFITNLAEDILQQNHHLKDQMITARKKLKKYQQQMITSLMQVNSSMESKAKIYAEESPQQILQYFINLINKSTKQGSMYEKKFNDQTVKNAKLTKKFSSLNKEHNQLSNTKNNIEQKCSQFERKLKKLQQQYQQNMNQMQQKHHSLLETISKLKIQLETLEINFQIKLKEEKKYLNQKYGKEILKIRQKSDVQIYQKEKEHRSDIDRKNKQIRALMMTINNYFGHTSESQSIGGSKKKNQKIQYLKYGEEEDNSIKNGLLIKGNGIKQERSEEQMRLLAEIIQPFSDHTVLNQKISELKKELINSNNNYRQTQTSLNNLQQSHSHTLEQLQILESKYQLLTKQHQKITTQKLQLQKEFRKCNEDKLAMEKYYDERWNHQFNNVKYNLSKKYSDLSAQVLNQKNKHDEMVNDRMKELNQFEEKIRKQKIDLQHKLSKSIQRNQQTKKVLFNREEELEDLRNCLKMGESMFIEEKNMIKFMLMDEIFQLKSRNLKLFSSIIQLNKTLQDNEIKRVSRQEQLKNYYHEKQTSALNELRNEFCIQTALKNNELEKLGREVSNHKEAIRLSHQIATENLHKQMQKIQKVKEREILDVKVLHFGQIKRLNEKIVKLDAKIFQKQEQFDIHRIKVKKEEQVLIKMIKQKQNLITQLENNNKNAEQLVKNVVDKYQVIKNQSKSLQLQKQSQKVENDSLTLQICNLKQQIKQLQNDKKTWLRNIQQAKEQYENGWKEVKKITNQKISFYRSRIWELESIFNSGIISKKQAERIRSLTEENKKLQNVINMKQAENLVLKEVNDYYEAKLREADSKMQINYELKDKKQPVFIRKHPKMSHINIRILKTQVSEDLQGFNASSAYQVKHYDTSKHNDKHSMANNKKLYDNFNRTKKNLRTNSSIM